jgi:hypothetical protein
MHFIVYKEFDSFFRCNKIVFSGTLSVEVSKSILYVIRYSSVSGDSNINNLLYNIVCLEVIPAKVSGRYTR